MTIKIFLTSVLSLTLCIGYSQKALKENLQGEWTKINLSLKDGSPVYDPSVKETQFSLDFRNDSLIVGVNGINSVQSYALKDSILTYGSNEYKISRFEEPIMELTQINEPENILALKIVFSRKKILDLSILPEGYIAKNKEKVYKQIPGNIEPKFIGNTQTAMDFVYERFRFPEYARGGFVARFVITKTGKMEGLKLIASSNPKYDQRLIDAIKKTQGKWMPARYQGQNVNCEVEFNYDLGWTKPSSTGLDPKVLASEYYDYGFYYFGQKSYTSAIEYFSKALEKDPYLIEAYYQRAASYVLKRDVKNACIDYQTLKTLGQVKATELYEKYCKE